VYVIRTTGEPGNGEVIPEAKWAESEVTVLKQFNAKVVNAGVIVSAPPGWVSESNIRLPTRGACWW
jgi:hypothetical protein